MARSAPATASADPSPREVRRSLKLDAVRSQVLEIAERAFAELGYHNTSLRLIAERCELAVGTLYTLFADKEDLFQAVIERRGHGFMESMKQIANGPLPPEDKLIRLAQLQVGFYEENPHWARIMTSFLAPGSRATLPGGRVARVYERSYRAAMTMEAGIIAEGQAQGVTRQGDPEALARIFAGLVSMHHVIMDEAQRVPMQFDSDELTEVIRAAFSVPRRRRTR